VAGPPSRSGYPSFDESVLEARLKAANDDYRWDDEQREVELAKIRREQLAPYAELVDRDGRGWWSCPTPRCASRAGVPSSRRNVDERAPLNARRRRRAIRSTPGADPRALDRA